MTQHDDTVKEHSDIAAIHSTSHVFRSQDSLLAEYQKRIKRQDRFPRGWRGTRLIDGLARLSVPSPAATPKTTLVFCYGGLGELFVNSHWLPTLHAAFGGDKGQLTVVWFTEYPLQPAHYRFVRHSGMTDVGLIAVNPNKLARHWQYRFTAIARLRRLGIARVLFPQIPRNPLIYDTVALAIGARDIWMYAPGPEYGLWKGEPHLGRVLVWLSSKYTLPVVRAMSSRIPFVDPVTAQGTAEDTPEGTLESVHRHAIERFYDLAQIAHAQIAHAQIAVASPAGLPLADVGATAATMTAGVADWDDSCRRLVRLQYHNTDLSLQHPALPERYGLINLATRSQHRFLSGDLYRHVIRRALSTSRRGSPAAENAAPNHAAENAAPKHVAENTAPKHVADNAAPKHVADNAAPKHVAENAAPEHVAENAAPTYEPLESIVLFTTYADASLVLPILPEILQDFPDETLGRIEAILALSPSTPAGARNPSTPAGARNPSTPHSSPPAVQVCHLSERVLIVVADHDLNWLEFMVGRSRWLLSPDTAAAHLAVILGVPSLVVTSIEPDTDINAFGYMFPYPPSLLHTSGVVQITVGLDKARFKNPTGDDLERVLIAFDNLRQSTYRG
ncbi:MAG: hypothetical protein K0U36_03365 [Alphaproteobacteria bacterium]|nr:hypothetical protein [Alphaproteobacteria bacterium]